MKKDLKKLNLSETAAGITNVLTKIRNNIYYIICRSIKFGFQVSLMSEECKLNAKLIKDL